MPIYEYHCEECDRSFETLVRPGRDEDAQCPSCNGVRLSREMSVFASGRTADSGTDMNGGAMTGGGCCGGSCGCH